MQDEETTSRELLLRLDRGGARPLRQQVEDALRGEGWAEVPAHEVGLAILGPLRELDEVAYLRFASVYRAFESAADFEAEIELLRHDKRATAAPTVAKIPSPRVPTG